MEKVKLSSCEIGQVIKKNATTTLSYKIARFYIGFTDGKNYAEMFNVKGGGVSVRVLADKDVFVSL